MTPRSYEFTCRVCGKTVTESSDNEVCANCAMNAHDAGAPPAPPPPPPPPARKAPQAPPPKKGGFTVTIRSVPVCKACGGKGAKGGCSLCGKKA